MLDRELRQLRQLAEKTNQVLETPEEQTKREKRNAALMFFYLNEGSAAGVKEAEDMKMALNLFEEKFLLVTPYNDQPLELQIETYFKRTLQVYPQLNAVTLRKELQQRMEKWAKREYRAPINVPPVLVVEPIKDIKFADDTAVVLADFERDTTSGTYLHSAVKKRAQLDSSMAESSLRPSHPVRPLEGFSTPVAGVDVTIRRVEPPTFSPIFGPIQGVNTVITPVAPVIIPVETEEVPVAPVELAPPTNFGDEEAAVGSDSSEWTDSDEEEDSLLGPNLSPLLPGHPLPYVPLSPPKIREEVQIEDSMLVRVMAHADEEDDVDFT